MVASDMKWRVNIRPRFTVLELGEYMAAEDGPRETILKNMRYERLARSLIYRQLRQAIASYLSHPIRDVGILERCRENLERQKSTATSPQQRENLDYEIRALDTFQRSVNALGISGFMLERAPPAAPLHISGVAVSVQPTAHIRVRRPRGSDLVGAVIIDVAKGDSPKTDKARAKIADAMAHSAVVVHEYVISALSDKDAKPSPDHAIIFHAYRQERVCAPSGYRKILRNVEAVCRNIARSWDGVDKPTGFDPRHAITRQ